MNSCLLKPIGSFCLKAILTLVFAVYAPMSVSAQSFNEHTTRAHYAGLYFSLPIGHGNDTQTSKHKMKFGFAAGLRQDQFGAYYNFTGRKTFDGRVMNLEFTGDGFQKLSLAGTNLLQKDANGTVVLLDDNGDGGMSLGGKILLGAGVAVVAAAGVMYVALKNAADDPCKENDC